MDEGETIEVGPGDLFHVFPGHDSWVVGDEPYVSLHFLGADSYATEVIGRSWCRSRGVSGRGHSSGPRRPRSGHG